METGMYLFLSVQFQWFLCTLLLQYQGTSATINPPRVFKHQKGMRRVGAPRKTVTLTTNEQQKATLLCAHTCYHTQWCRSFNVGHTNGQCDLFDSDSACNDVSSDPNYTYSVKASVDERVCEVLKVTDGVDVAAGTKHQESVNISCKTNFTSYYDQFTCKDGSFKPQEQTTNDRLSTVSCIENLVCGLRWGGQCFKLLEHGSAITFTAGKEACAAVGAVLATVIDTAVLEFVKELVGSTGVCTWIGLVQKDPSGPKADGWQWINSGNDTDVIDMDTNPAALPIAWRANKPDGNQGFGMIFESEGKIDDITPSYIGVKNALCQITDPSHQFLLVESCKRIALPFERQFNGTDLTACKQSCTASVFCRAFSYSLVVGGGHCIHHSAPPESPSANVVEDSDYNVYA